MDIGICNCKDGYCGELCQDTGDKCCDDGYFYDGYNKMCESKLFENHGTYSNLHNKIFLILMSFVLQILAYLLIWTTIFPINRM